MMTGKVNREDCMMRFSIDQSNLPHVSSVARIFLIFNTVPCRKIHKPVISFESKEISSEVRPIGNPLDSLYIKDSWMLTTTSRAAKAAISFVSKHKD